MLCDWLGGARTVQSSINAGSVGWFSSSGWFGQSGWFSCAVWLGCANWFGCAWWFMPGGSVIRGSSVMPGGSPLPSQQLVRAGICNLSRVLTTTLLPFIKRDSGIYI